MALSIRLRSRMATRLRTRHLHAGLGRSISIFRTRHTEPVPPLRHWPALQIADFPTASRLVRIEAGERQRCCTRWVARSQPASTLSSAPARRVVSEARATCAWIFRAPGRAQLVRSVGGEAGVRSRSVAHRSNSRFRFSTSGRLPPVYSPFQGKRGARIGVAPPVASAPAGSNPRVTFSQTSKANAGRAKGAAATNSSPILSEISSRLSYARHLHR